MPLFQLHSPYKPSGDQPQAIEELSQGLANGLDVQVLLGATGTGKTYSIAHVISQASRPVLVLSHNKTLAAQLYGELKKFFPENAVEYFVSYYDYYQPEAYVPSSDNYIPKDSQINEQIDKLRHSATRSLLERDDVIIVSSVSCIYGIGSREAYDGMLLRLEVGNMLGRREIIEKLVEILYERNDVDFHRGCFRVRGDVIEVFPAHEDQKALRIELFGDEVESISLIDPLRGRRIRPLRRMTVYPASHYVTTRERMEEAITGIRKELEKSLLELRLGEKLVEAQRLEQRTLYDLEMLEETGRCKGIENYSRHLSGRKEGQPPPTLLEYFPREWLLVVDESHVAVPQLRAMYKGDRSRKETLVRHGFRLPSALDNRPLQFHEVWKLVHQVIFVSATPGHYELERTEGLFTEQIIRPTGLLDPLVEVRPLASQVDDLFDVLRELGDKDQRALVTTLTKRMAQELTHYYNELGLKVRYLHSDIDTLERVGIVQDLRTGEFDVLVGINLLREGLDIPEVSLVAILDADKEGFLRNRTSLIQSIGRAARNVEGRAILYADRFTNSMKQAIDETERRRKLQSEWNSLHGISPESIKKAVDNPLAHLLDAERIIAPKRKQEAPGVDPELYPVRIKQLHRLMKKAASRLEFEKAADLRDQIRELEGKMLGLYR